MIAQTLALLLDAYRELNSRKLFWITMILSGIVVLVYAAFGLNENGMTFLHWQFNTPWITSEIIPPDKFYMYTFATLGVPIWLTWAQTILALVSTASIIPDFVAGGSIELVLCRPISRLRLFLTKYATGLLFVALQVFVFSLACFLVIGIRGGAWRPSIFLAVPIVLAFFSYLFAFCTLFGLLTRSAIASLLLTVVVWFGLFIVNAADGGLLLGKVSAEVEVERIARKVDQQERAARERLDELAAKDESVRDEDGDLPLGADDELEAANPFLHRTREELATTERRASGFETWSQRATLAKTILPKTADTISLLSRHLLTAEDTIFLTNSVFGGGQESDDAEVQKRLEDETRERTLWWVLGTSLLFEVGVLGIGVWIFSRRDF